MNPAAGNPGKPHRYRALWAELNNRVFLRTSGGAGLRNAHFLDKDFVINLDKERMQCDS